MCKPVGHIPFSQSPHYHGSQLPSREPDSNWGQRSMESLSEQLGLGALTLLGHSQCCFLLQLLWKHPELGAKASKPKCSFVPGQSLILFCFV